MWGQRLAESGLSNEEAAAYARRLSDAKKAKEIEVYSMRKAVRALEDARSEAAQIVSESRVPKEEREGLPRGTAEYLALRQTRQEVREARKKLVPQERQLEALRKEAYRFNKLAKASKGQA
ncbi:hypothetical protein BGW38_010271, partial [Lunasporangiospora selenospora]